MDASATGREGCGVAKHEASSARENSPVASSPIRAPGELTPQSQVTTCSFVVRSPDARLG